MKKSISAQNVYSSYLVILMLIFTSSCFSQNRSQDQGEDYQLVIEAVEDYVLALYDVEPHRIAKSVDTSLYKIGYYEYNGKAYNNVRMSFEQLYQLSAEWNKDGNQVDDQTPKEIEVYEVHDKTASAKLTAKWGIDFMHLAKVNGQWKIMNIMWQSPPK